MHTLAVTTLAHSRPGLNQFCFLQVHAALPLPLPQWKAALVQKGQEQVLSAGQGACWDGSGKLVRVPGSFNLLSPYMCTGNGCLCPLGVGWLHPLQVHTILGNSRFLLSREQCQGKKGWSSLGCTLGHSWETSHSPGQFQSASSTLFPGINNGVYSLFMSRVSVSYNPPVSSTGFQTSYGDLSSQCQTPELRCPVCVPNP